jgi:hypothetical protein
MLEVRNAGFLGDVKGVQQMVGHSPAFFHADLGGPDVHAPVLLHGLGIDDLTAKFQGQPHCQIRLAGTSGPDDSDDRRLPAGGGNCCTGMGV